jgi:hypothetical protein
MHVCIRDVLHHWPAQANKYYVYFLSSYIYHIYPRAAVFVSETFFDKRYMFLFLVSNDTKGAKRLYCYFATYPSVLLQIKESLYQLFLFSFFFHLLLS